MPGSVYKFHPIQNQLTFKISNDIHPIPEKGGEKDKNRIKKRKKKIADSVS